MTKTNKEIVVEFFEQIINQKRLDLYETYVSPECIGHNPPFIGIGIWFGALSEPGKVFIREVAQGGPADGILQAGDEIISITDDNETLDTYEAISFRNVGPGVIGTTVEFVVRREGQEHKFKFTRGIIPALDTHWRKSDFENFFKEVCPDLCFETRMTVEEGDLVAYYGVDSGTWLVSGSSVIFGECGMFRLKDGKIIESWAITDDAARMRQEGYQMLAPEKKPVP